MKKNNVNKHWREYIVPKVNVMHLDAANETLLTMSLDPYKDYSENYDPLSQGRDNSKSACEHISLCECRWKETTV